MRHFTLIVLLACSINLHAQRPYEIFYLNGEYDEIIKHSKALTDTSDYFWNALAIEKTGDILRAIEILESGLEVSSSISIEQLLASYYYQTGQYQQAKPLLKKHWVNNELFLNYVKVLEFEEDYPQAIEVLCKRRLSDTLNITYLKHLGLNYFRVDSLGKAIYYFEKLFALNNKDQQVAKRLAGLYIKNKMYEKALATCDTVLSRDSLNISFIKLRAKANFSIPNFSAAIPDFTTLCRLGDSSKFVLKHLGICELNESLFNMGHRHLALAYNIDSNDYETTFFFGKSFRNSPNPENGFYYLNRTESLLEPDPKIISAIYIERNSIYNELLEYAKALECYKEAYRYDPKPEYLFHIASYYENLIHDKQAALMYYEKFIDNLPEQTEAQKAEHEKKGQITISMKDVANERIIRLKEELFFEGELE